MYTLLIPIWKRPTLTKRVVEYYKERQEKFNFHLCLVGSEDPDYGKKHGVDYVHSKNWPISEKWENGMLYCKSQDIEGVLMAGSDDYLDDNILKYIGTLKGDTEYALQWKDVYMYRCRDNKLSLWSSGKMGVGRFFSRSALNKTGWRLFQSEYLGRNGLDHHVHLQMRAHGIEWINKSMFDVNGIILDVKYEDNLSPHAIVDAAPERMKSELPEYIQQELLYLRTQFKKEVVEAPKKIKNLEGMARIVAIGSQNHKMKDGEVYEVSAADAMVLIEKGFAYLEGEEPKKKKAPEKPKEKAAPKRTPRKKPTK